MSFLTFLIVIFFLMTPVLGMRMLGGLHLHHYENTQKAVH